MYPHSYHYHPCYVADGFCLSDEEVVILCRLFVEAIHVQSIQWLDKPVDYADLVLPVRLLHTHFAQ